MYHRDQPHAAGRRLTLNDMTQQTDVTYVAQITLTMPGRPDVATAIVTLTPADRIPLAGKAKPLSECTLAELSAYGEKLESEVWADYESITLLDLHDDANIDIQVMALDKDGQAVDEVEDWLKHNIVLRPPGTELPPAEPVPADDEVQGSEESQPAEQEAERTPEKTDAQPNTTLTVHPSAANEAGTAPESLPVVPTIIPSQARVRLAGGRLPLAQSGGAAADILLDEAPLRAMQAHALSSLEREVAGVMIGRQPEKQPDGRYVVHVIDSIVAKHTVMHGASVTYTPESWRYMNDTLWERYPDESAVMVGWYHTHPGFGIFLSGMDLFIHQNFFTQIWHVAYVLDPRARTSGFFCWNRQKTKVNRYDFQWPEWAAGSW